MYSQLPIIATDTVGPRKYLPDEAGVFVDESNAEQQADVVEELLNDPERRAKMGRAGRKRVVDEYSWERESKKLLNIYSELTQGQRKQTTSTATHE